MLAPSFNLIDRPAMGPTQHQYSPTTQVAEKVMRRIEIAKVSRPTATAARRPTADPLFQVARNLQDCLAFASFKAQNGWQDRTLSTIETEVTEKLSKRKRPYPEDLNTSDASSTLSEDASTSSRHTITKYRDPTRSYAAHRKRVRATSNTGRHTQSVSWSRENNVGCIPSMNRPHTVDVPFSSLQDSPMFDAPSTPPTHDDDLAVPAMQAPSSSIISSSPPRTPPPPAHRNLARPKQAGAELLHYLGEPHTPTVHVQHISSTVKDRPSTPAHHISSSRLQTPGNLSLLNGLLHTPGNFNLAEFCNVTPSPAQAQFGRVSLLGQSPVPSARRTLNFESSTHASPATQRQLGRGLALQLGDELRR